jgi:uncharacterized membrane protein
MATFFTILYVLLIAIIVYLSRKQSTRRTNVLPFRNYHRIEYLKKKRVSKTQKKEKK